MGMRGDKPRERLNGKRRKFPASRKAGDLEEIAGIAKRQGYWWTHYSPHQPRYKPQLNSIESRRTKVGAIISTS